MFGNPSAKTSPNCKTRCCKPSNCWPTCRLMVRANDYKIDDTVENLRVATDNLDQLTDSLKQRPWSLIRIKQPKEREVPQK